VIGTVTNTSVDEEDVPGLNGNSGNSYGDANDLTPNPGPGINVGGNAREVGGALAISWGSDNGN